MYILSIREFLRDSRLRRFPLIIVLAASVLVCGNTASAGKPDIDPSYANGQLVYMIGPHLITNAITTQPNLYAHSEELYLLVYPINPGGTDTDAKTLPSGYQPNCDPCYHPGLPGMFAYHDHVLAGAPGMGTAGTAGLMKGPWKIILLVYNPAFFNDPNFVPIKSEADIDVAEGKGEFLVVNPNGSNPFEIETGNVLICPVVSPAA